MNHRDTENTEANPINGSPVEALDPRLNAISKGILGAAIEVHRVLGPGFPESVYEEALVLELELRGIRHSRQHPISLEYKGRKLGQQFLDLLVESQVVVELKAVECLLPIHKAQILSYLRATRCRLGLLINFNSVVLKDGIKRIVL